MANEIQLRIGKSSIYNPDERLRSLRASFDVTLDALSEKLKALILKLTIFNSPFPIKAPVKILSSATDNDTFVENDIIQLYNRSLLTRIESDDLYGKIKSDYWLYTFHPATKNYVEDKVQKESTNNQIQTFQSEQKKNFGYFCLNLLEDTYNSIGKDNHRDSFARFNLLIQSKENDFEKSIGYLQDIDDVKSSAYILSYLGLISRNMGLYLKAIDYHNQSLELFDGIDDKYGLKADYTNIGVAYRKMGDYPKALEYYNKALDIDESLNNRVGMAKNYGNIGIVYYKMGDYPKALDYHNKAREIRESLSDRVGMAKDYNNIGIVYKDMGYYPKALEYYNKALDIDESLNNRVGTGREYGNIGIVYYKMGDYPKALDYHNKAREIRESLSDRVGMAKDYNNIGIVYKDMGYYPKASRVLQQSIRH